MIDLGGKWCILRTGGQRTIALMRSLSQAGYRVWTPIAVRRMPPRRDGKVRERAMPIMPTFVFADEAHLDDLAHEAIAPVSDHPDFAIFRRGDSVPLIGEREVAGLRQAEAEAQAQIDLIREHEGRLAARQARAELMRTDRARRKALRAQRIPMAPGTFVEVNDVPMLAGLVGEVVESKAAGAAHVVAFGGSLRMEIEAWRLMPNGVADRG